MQYGARALSVAMDTAASCILACLLFTQVTSHGHDVFGYTKEEQQLWSEHSDACAGRLQSPIRITSHRAQRLPIPALEMVGFHNPLPGPVIATNTGHSVSLRPSPAAGGESWPKVFGALLLDDYRLESLHFHWGHRFSRGSEHVLNGIRFPMEMHVVHRNMKYASLNEAMQKWDGLVVLAFFFQAQEKSSAALQPILRVLERVQFPGDSAPLEQTFPLASLLSGADTDAFYTYRGSLTTPPCSEAVTWLVFPDALPISFNQIKKFRRIYSGEKRMVNNFRVLQPLNSRNVFVRKLWKIKSHNLTSHDAISWLN